MRGAFFASGRRTGAGAVAATFFGGAFLAGAFAGGAFLTTAFLAGAFLTGAFLPTALFAGAFFGATFAAAEVRGEPTRRSARLIRPDAAGIVTPLGGAASVEHHARALKRSRPQRRPRI